MISVPSQSVCTFGSALLVAGLISGAAAIAGPAPHAIDFSSAGYAGGVEPPVVPARLRVAPLGDGRDDTAVLQAALDAVAALPPDAHGWRGAVALEPGVFHLAGQLRLTASGVVLRGNASTLLATGRSRRTLIEVHGTADRSLDVGRRVTDDHVPAGAVTLTLADVSGLSPGMRLVVRRPCPAEWIAALRMDQFKTAFAPGRVNWKPGSRELEWERTLTAVDAKARTITLDAPVTTALEARFGGATVHRLTWPGRLRQVGVENLECESSFDPLNLADEEHAWIALHLDRVEDAWVRRVTARHFAGPAFYVGPDARAVTLTDCANELPVAENGGWRRMGFYAGGQQVLVRGCTTTQGRRDFVAGFCSTGPTVFLDCTATGALADSGPFESWASGVLYDNVRIEGAGLALANVGLSAQGAGWTAANCVLWNCSAVTMHVDHPPGAANLVVTDAANPSLYRAQLAARADSPPAADDPAAAAAPAVLFTGPVAPPPPPPPPRRLEIVNGRFTVDGHLLLGGAESNPWWASQIVPSWARELGSSPTHWTPGHIGRGLTEDLDALTDRMVARGDAFYQTWPGLWQDRRRDDHSRLWRPDGDTWAPFFELPWARSGQGRGADGLSKFDLTRFNPWYWSRLRELADRCAAKGLVHVDYFYNNHNLQEAGAHWMDFPWRPANCLQATGFPEPPPWDGPRNTTIHVADIFYDVTDPVRRDLHTRFIRHGLEVFAGASNVIHSVGFQFAGPVEFQKFFLGVVADWNRTAAQPARIALHTSKAVTDAVLADPALAPLVSVIDLRYWHYLPDGTLFAPDGRGKLAFRELRNRAFNGDAVPGSTPELVYRQVREYRDRHPDKAIISGGGGAGFLPAIMAGAAAVLRGDFPVEGARDGRTAATFLPFLRHQVGDVLPQLTPRNPPDAEPWVLADAGHHALVYSRKGAAVELPAAFRDPGYRAVWFNPRDGSTHDARLTGGTTQPKPTDEAWLLWLTSNTKH